MKLSFYGQLCAGFCVAVAILMANSGIAAVFNHEPAKHRVIAMLKHEQLGELADSAFDAMFKRADKELRKRGFDADADLMTGEWERTYHGALATTSWDTGDHAPISEWIQVQYQKLEDRLGVNVMEMTRLRDIWVLNFTIPVTFDPHQDSVWCAEQLANYPDDLCSKEYERHFAGTHWVPGEDDNATAYRHGGFAGVVTYWVVFGICEASVWGSDATFLCGPAGTLAQIAVERYVAPKVSAKIWESKN